MQCQDGLLVSIDVVTSGLHLQKPFPRCKGRMINLFDLSAGMAGTKTFADKGDRDGSPVRRNRSDGVKKPIDPVGAHVDDRPRANELRKSLASKRSGGTPMKMLIAQEMSKETDSKRKPPSIVAKLMGLDDTPPVQRPILSAKRTLEQGHPRSKSTGALQGRWQEEDVYFHRPKSCEIHSCSHEKEYKNVYEVWEQPSRTNRTRDHAPLKGRCNENQNEKRMALVRQKFTEAKRLATDEKLLQSKEFQDALEVLSSNRDLFLKFLEEPNSLFSKHIKEFHTISSPPQTKCITVLKPSKTVEPKGEKHVKKQQSPQYSGNEWEIDRPYRGSNFSHPKAESLSQSTRIVVLKPNPAKTHDVKAVATTAIPSPELPQQSDFYTGFDTNDTMGSREIAKEITQQMRECVTRHRRDESLLSSVLSNGYIGDDSSFDKSEDEYIEEDVGNFSDSEIMTPTSRNSWDYKNRIDSPYSLSSFSRTSYSPESSVITEAKKRLWERWAWVASNGSSQEQMKVRRSSSTLGEMLAIPEVNKEGSNGVLAVLSSRSCDREEELRAPGACLSIGRTKDGDGGESSPRNLSRSKSVPVSSSAFENIRIDTEPFGSQICKSIVPKEATKSKSGKSSFKGKVSNFFSRNKKSGKQKTIPSPPLVGDEEQFQSGSAESVTKSDDNLSKSVHNYICQESRLKISEEESGQASSPASCNYESKKAAYPPKVAISLEKPSVSGTLRKNQSKLRMSENSSVNQDQPSPTSVLDALFGDDVHNIASLSSQIANAAHSPALSRSAQIESIARSFSWEDTLFKTSLTNSLKRSRADEEEQEWFMFVQNLLSSSGLDNERVNTIFTRWHSPESPLDPMLLFRILGQRDEGAKTRERRSSQRLLFDCVNAALLDISNAALLNARPWARACTEAWQYVQADALVAAEVWELVKGWFSSEGSRVSFENDNSSLVVDRLLRKEVTGRGWAELMQMDRDEVCREIGGNLLEDLVGEALLDFIDGCS